MEHEFRTTLLLHALLNFLNEDAALVCNLFLAFMLDPHLKQIVTSHVLWRVFIPPWSHCSLSPSRSRFTSGVRSWIARETRLSGSGNGGLETPRAEHHGLGSVMVVVLVPRAWEGQIMVYVWCNYTTNKTYLSYLSSGIMLYNFSR